MNHFAVVYTIKCFWRGINKTVIVGYRMCYGGNEKHKMHVPEMPGKAVIS